MFEGHEAHRQGFHTHYSTSLSRRKMLSLSLPLTCLCLRVRDCVSVSMCHSPPPVFLDIVQRIHFFCTMNVCVCVCKREREKGIVQACASVSPNRHCLPVGFFFVFFSSTDTNSVQDVSSYSAPGEASVNELIGDLMP